MTRTWAITLFWATLLAIHWVVMWAIFNPDVLPAALLGGSALLTALGAAHLAWLARSDRRRRGEVVVEAVPDLSLATVLVGVAFAALPLGAFLGPWISLIGAGALLWGLVGVVNERRASRRAAAAVAGRDLAPGGRTAVGPEGAAGHERAVEGSAEGEADAPGRRGKGDRGRDDERAGARARAGAEKERSDDEGGRRKASTSKGGEGKGGGGRRSSSRSRRSSRK